MGKAVGTIIFALVAALSGAIGFYVWSGDYERTRVAALAEQRAREAENRADELVRRNAELVKQKKLLADKLSRLGAERLVAKAMVIYQVPGPDGSVKLTKGVFEEVGRKKGFLPAKTFEVPGDTIHFDALLVQFPKESVAEGDPLRGHTLHLFRRIYGDTQAPTEGLYFDTNREIPDIYRVSDDPSEYETQLWDSFWAMALDPRLAESNGVKVALGQDVYTKMVPGKIYELTLQSNGGLAITAKDIQGAGVRSQGSGTEGRSTPVTPDS